MSDLMSRLKKTSKSKLANSLDKTDLLDRGLVTTSIIPLNIALSGSVDGGLGNGLTIFAGPSKHFKSNMCLSLVDAYLKKYEDSVCIFYDVEFGITDDYMKTFGIDPSRVLHVPIETVEDLKIDMVNQLDEIKRGDRVIFLIDSLGQIASQKETDDAKEGNVKVDMTRAKALKSFTRLISTKLVLKDIPCVAVNHTYESLEMFSKTVMSGGTGVMYSANTVIIIGRRQIKDGKVIVGYEFVLNAEKSRFTKEKSKINMTVTFDSFISDYGDGLLAEAVESGFVVKPSNGWYCRAFLDESTGEIVVEDKKYRKTDADTKEFWNDLIEHKPFQRAITNKFTLSNISEESLEDV